MPHLPEPRFTSSIPSIHDDTTLAIRIYHPEILSRPQSTSKEAKQWRKKGVVVAHPYAPMGGCYDDRVVGIVAEEFLKAGWIVGTFNFRGTPGSKARTSWSGKPELDDYISFAGFFMHYMSYLRPFPSPGAVFAPEQSPSSPRTPMQNEAPDAQKQSPVVILGGYSYGSLILRHLPPVPSILQPFCSPLSGSAANEILLRTNKLADQANLEWINLARDRDRQKRRGHEKRLSVTMGGEETAPEIRRSSRDSRRSLDGRRSLEVVGRRLRSLSHRRRQEDDTPLPPESPSRQPSITVPEVRYLLVSPIMPPLSTLAAPALAPKFWNRSTHSVAHDVIAKHDSLAIFGDQDMFASVKKLRDWATKMQTESGFRFTSIEVKGAGHFWHDEEAERELRTALERWEKRVAV